MDILAELISGLQNYPHIAYQQNGDSVSVLPADENGFTVSLSVKEREVIIYFNAWHETFHLDEHEDLQDNEELALELFGWGLSPRTRLKETLRGETPVAWTAEFLKEGQWKPDSTTGVFSIALWKRKTVRYRQNHFIE